MVRLRMKKAAQRRPLSPSWSCRDSNPGPSACHADALPTAPQPRKISLSLKSEAALLPQTPQSVKQSLEPSLPSSRPADDGEIVGEIVLNDPPIAVKLIEKWGELIGHVIDAVVVVRVRPGVEEIEDQRFIGEAQ